MSWSLDFFKSEKKKQLEKLQIKEQKLKNKILKKQLKENLENPKIHPIDDNVIKEFLNTPLKFIEEKPYTSVKLVNDVLIVVLSNGDVITKSQATQDDFIAVRNSKTEDEILVITSGKELREEKQKEQKAIKKAVALKDGIDKLNKFKDFSIKDGSVYLKGIERSLPQIMVEKFLEIVDSYTDKTLKNCSEYNALKQFWMKCCLNPNAQSAEDLYTFLSHHQFKIDRHGNFYAYRRVQSKTNDNKVLVDFISNVYNKVKAVWKQDSSKYEVVKVDGEYKIEKTKKSSVEHSGEWIGNLKDLYLDLPNYQENSYTSAHTGLEDYRIGSVISMPRNEGDDNNQISCSKGFHAASKEYDYSSFGDTPILVIINPIDVLSVPLNEVGKLRTCRWFFAMTLTEEEQHILDDENFDVTHLGDIFEELCSKDLEKYIHNSFTEEVKRHTFQIPEMSNIQIKKIVKSLNEMKDEIKGRVQKII